MLLVLLGCGRAPHPAAMKLEAMPMLPAVRAQLDSLSANPGMMEAAMPQHQKEVRTLMEAMRNDMTRLGMHSDPAYEALADSVVEGSDQLASARGPDVARLAAQHIDQIRRLMANYEAKTGSTER